MGVFRRFNTIVKANLNDLITKAEDPEKMLDQALADMRGNLRQSREQVIEVIADGKMMEKMRSQFLAESASWTARARLALQKGDEPLAREAVIRKTVSDAQVAGLDKQIETQKEYVGALKESLVVLQRRIEEARVRKGELKARARRAKATAKAAKVVARTVSEAAFADSSPFETFERMEDKILTLEARVEAYAEIASEMPKFPTEVEISARLQSLRESTSVEEELERLKQERK